MKISIPFLLFLAALTSCEKHVSAEADKISNTFAICFANVDTTKGGQSVSCGEGAYKLINGKYVLWVSLRFPIQFDSCYTVNIDSLNGIETAQLVFYPQDKATLANLCSDIVICNNPIPTQTLIAESGQLLIGFSNPIMLHGNKTQHASVLIKNLVFVDKDTGEKIEIKNELIWKVLNLGTPG